MRARSLSSREGLGSGGEIEAQARPPLSFICTESSRGPSHHSLLSRLRLRRGRLPPGQASPAHTAGVGPCSEEELMMSRREAGREGGDQSEQLSIQAVEGDVEQGVIRENIIL